MKKGRRLIYMATNESPLKKLLKDLQKDGLQLKIKAMKETITAEQVADEYLSAIKLIDDFCKNRNRY